MMMIFLSLSKRFDWICRIIYCLGYSIFCISETQSDLQDMGFPIYPRSSFGPNGLGLSIGLLPWGLGITLGAFGGHREWAFELIFQTPSVAPQPLCTKCVGKGCISSRIGCNFHASVRGWVS